MDRGLAIAIAKRAEHPAPAGERHGRLVCLGDGPIDWKTKCGKRRRAFICECDCGKRPLIAAGNWYSGISNSCGCLKDETTFARCFKGVGSLTGTYIGRVKRRAEEGGISFSVSKEYLWSLFQQQGAKCALTGLPIDLAPPTAKKRGLAVQTASLDRINSMLGYEPGNVQWVHATANKMKLDHTQENFLWWCRQVVAHAESKV